MKRGYLFLPLILFLAVHVSASEYLIRVDNLSEKDFTIVERIENHAIVLAGDQELNTLRQKGIPFIILCEDPNDKLFLFVFPQGENLATIARFGQVLDQYEGCLLLKTTEDRIPDLNNLKVELARLNLRPIQNVSQPCPDFADLRADTLIQQMVNAVSQESIRVSILRMQRMYTRYATHDSNRVVAVNWIANRLRAYGCDSVYLHNFSGSYGRNIIGIKRGKRFTGWKRYCVIDGHMDDVPSSGYAPGADDNASGTTAVLEAARVMKNFNFEYTIRYIGFNAEEQGLVGSAAYASNARTQGDTILGVLNFDMIGYVSAPTRDTMNAHYTTAVPGCSTFVCSFVQAIADTYTQLKIRKVRNTGTGGSSDHASFWQNGYIAMCGIERVLCPGYHTIGDTIGPSGVNSLPFATLVIKTGVAALAKLAVPIHLNIEEEFGNEVRHRIVVYPNPARSFKIFYQIDKDRELKLAVYNTVGQEIRTLAQGNHQSGFHAAIWDGRDRNGRELAAGVYFLRLCGGDETRLEKLILLR